MSKVKLVHKIEMEIDGKKIKLSVNEAKELYTELGVILNLNKSFIPNYSPTLIGDPLPYNPISNPPVMYSNPVPTTGEQTYSSCSIQPEQDWDLNRLKTDELVYFNGG